MTAVFCSERHIVEIDTSVDGTRFGLRPELIGDDAFELLTGNGTDGDELGGGECPGFGEVGCTLCGIGNRVGGAGLPPLLGFAFRPAGVFQADPFADPAAVGGLYWTINLREIHLPHSAPRRFKPAPPVETEAVVDSQCFGD